MKEGKVFKRILAIALVVVMTITMMPFGVFAEGEATGDATPCEHTWVAGVCSKCEEACAHNTGYEIISNKPATCEKPANNRYYQCKSCKLYFNRVTNNQLIEVILPSDKETGKALGHDFADATCTEPKKCRREGCDKTEGAALGHTGGRATCVAKATCSECGEVYGDLAAHAWATEFTVDKEANCTEAGSKSKHCTVVGCTEKTEVTTIDAAHAWATEFTVDEEATCKKAGSKSIHCTKCTEKKDVTPIAIVPHNVDEVAFTKYNDEYHSKKCAVCGTDVAMAKHSFGDFVVTDQPNCTDKGEKTSTCKACGATKTAEVDAKGHDWQNGECLECHIKCTHEEWNENVCKNCAYICSNHIYDKPTCKDAAICKTCGTTVKPADPSNHASTEVVVKNSKEAKCYEPGYTGDTYHKCCDTLKERGKATTAEHVYATTLSKVSETKHGYACTNEGCTAYDTEHAEDHDYKQNTVIRPATCAREGEAIFKCDACGAVKTDEIAKLTTHTWATVGTTTPATCVAEGKTEYDCTVEGCEEKKVEKIAIVADAHNWETEGEVTKAATCREKGEKTFECTNTGCTATKKEDIAIVADAHTWNAGTVTKAATCKEKGEKSFACTNTGCTETKKEDIAIDPDAHDITGVAFEKISDAEHGKKCKLCNVVVAKAAHAYTEDAGSKTPTCTTEGSETKRCVCGDTKTTKLDKNDNHDWGTWTDTLAATCTTDGSKERTCRREGCTGKETAKIDKLGHNMEEVEAKAATCQATGNNKYYACDRCDKFFKDEAGTTETTVAAETLAKGEHNFAKYVYNVNSETCTKEGTETAKCANEGCDATHTRDKVGTMVAHTFKNYVSDGNATCIADGTKSAVCEMCKEAKDTVADKDSHKVAPHKPDSTGRKCELCNAELVCTHTYSVEKMITKTPTCTVDGEKAIVCSKCKAVKEGSVEVIAKTGHAWDEGEVITAASCKEEGKMKYKCNNMCGETKEETVKKTDHNYKEVITHATCTEAGYSTFTCTMCGSHYVDKPVEAYGHMFETYFYDEGSATCYQDGTKTAECANGCGTKNTVADPGSKTDHEMTDFTVITPATCTTDGEEEAKCFYHEKCGYSEIVPVEALGHDESGEFVETKAATCTEKGEKQKTCTRCPEIVATEEIPALGHDETAEFVETLAATCTTDGSKEKKCARCSEVIATEAIPALGHDIAAEYTIDVPATCTTEGSQSKHCSRCDYKDGVVAIPASGHDMQPGEGTTATCTEPGKAVFVCANGCGKTHEEANVPALGHSFTYTSNGDATCQADGTKTGKCIRCDVTETVPDEGSMLEHVFGEPVIDKASTEKGGLVTTKCTNCEYEEVEEIAMIDSLKLKYETVVYDGKYKRPSLTITDAEGAKLIKGEDYLLELPEKDECINAGTYTYTVTFIGNYEGEATLTYKVVPGKASKIVSKGTKQTYIDLKWSTVKGADGYRIYVKTSSGGWKKLATVKGKTTYRVKDLKAGTNYTFAVKAFSKAADGETTIWATEFAEQAFKTLPGKTSKLTAKTSKNAVKLTWKEVKGAEGYRVYVKTAKGGWKTVATVKGGKVTYTVKGLKANATYEYAVKAFYKDGSATVWSNQFTTVKAKTAK